MFRTAVPLIGLFGGIAGLFVLFALAAGPGSVRTGLLLLAGIFALVAALLFIRARLARRFLNAYHGIIELRSMDPLQFEHYIANLFRKLGFKAKVMGGSGDIGVDIVLTKNGVRSVVQCKRYGAHLCVDSPAIQQFVGSMQIYKVRQGFFVATARFTPPAIKLAAGHGITIIDDERLAEMIRKTFPKK